ncbi:hypothetical protein TorRG33x02_118390 [Trema orientale]|uniref:Uncharacterized protein n=1 Tax=Trema orientale TaxID=63057 RepID=A0A2P5F3H3_TREOI|nr:hypothetical protein TorRG33x02_118390 [Trema orientale]
MGQDEPRPGTKPISAYQIWVGQFLTNPRGNGEFKRRFRRVPKLSQQLKLTATRKMAVVVLGEVELRENEKEMGELSVKDEKGGG